MHNIHYYEYPENVNKKTVQKELDQLAAYEDYQEGCTGLGQKIRWLDKIGICSDRDTAEEMIRRNDSGWYDQLAVRFYVPKEMKSKTADDLKKKMQKAYDAYRDADSVLWAKRSPKGLLGCLRCGSKLNREFIKTNKCPVCLADLRPESKLKEIAVAKERWKKAQNAHDKYIIDHAKREIKWLVKIEYHT